MKPDDRLLRYLWPFIARGIGADPAEEEEVKWLLQTQRRVLLTRMTQGDMLRLQEWFGWARVMLGAVLPQWHLWLHHEKGCCLKGAKQLLRS